MTDLQKGNLIVPNSARGLIERDNPFKVNHEIYSRVYASGGNNNHVSKIIKNLMVGGSYPPSYLLYQYLETDKFPYTIDVVDVDEETGSIKMTPEIIYGPAAGIKGTDMQLMNDIYNVKKTNLEKEVFGPNPSESEIKKKLDVAALLKFQEVAYAYKTNEVRLGIQDEFFKFVYKLYQQTTQNDFNENVPGLIYYGSINNPNLEERYDAIAQSALERLYDNSYHRLKSPGHEMLPLLLPKRFLSPFGSFENDQVQYSLNQIRYKDLAPYISDKMLLTKAKDIGSSSTKIYIGTSEDNLGLQFYEASENIFGSRQPKSMGYIPYKSFAAQITFHNKMAMLEDLADYLPSETAHKEIFQLLKNFKKEIDKGGKKPMPMRNLYEITPDFYNGLNSERAKLYFENAPGIETILGLTEFNNIGNQIRSVFTEETTLGIIDREVIVDLLKRINVDSTSKEIQDVINTMRGELIEEVKEAYDEGSNHPAWPLTHQFRTIIKKAANLYK